MAKKPPVPPTPAPRKPPAVAPRSAAPEPLRIPAGGAGQTARGTAKRAFRRGVRGGQQEAPPALADTDLPAQG